MRRLAAAAVLALAAPAALACGVCIEDKVAAAYDHAVVTRAVDRGWVVVFAEVKGAGDAAAAARRLGGVDASSVRVSQQPGSLSFALDPRRRSPREALAAIERAAAPLRLELLKVMP